MIRFGTCQTLYIYSLSSVVSASLLLIVLACTPATDPSITPPPLPTPDPQPKIKLATNQGDIVIELFTQQAPQAAASFKDIFESGYYDRAIFHEVSQRLIYGGRFSLDLDELESKPLFNESNNGLINKRGYVALYGPEGEDSGNPGFLINLNTNAGHDFDLEEGELVDYTVIGKVVEGMDVADTIGKMATRSNSSPSLNALPETPVMVNNRNFNGEYPDDGDTDTDDFITTSSGLKYKDVVVGTGDVIAPDATVTVYYTGRLNDENGEIFDSTEEGEPATFSLDSVIQGWQEGLGEHDMRVGGTRILIIPPELGYGDTDRPGIPGGSTLWFEVEVIDAVDNSTDTNTRVALETSMGEIVLELMDDEAPVTVDNFLQYVSDGFYDGTIFHRVMQDFVVQGGGYLPDLTEKEGVRDPIVNEFSPDRSNVAYTVAMAKLGNDPDSATSQFFFNLVDNSSNLDNQNGGFTVFANIVEGRDVVDEMGLVETITHVFPDEQGGTRMEYVPVDDIILISATIE